MALTKVTNDLLTLDAAQPSITSTGTLTGLTVTGEITANGGIALGDGDAATFGDSDDLSISHAGGSTYLTNTTGSLVLRSDSFRVLNTANSEQILHGDANGAVTAYYDNAAKLATTATGIDVTGTATADALTVQTSTYTKINSYFSGSYTSGFKFSDMNGGIWYDASVDDLTVSAGHANSQLILEAGGGEKMRIDASGRVTMPSQPVFSHLGIKAHSISTTGTQVMSASNVWSSDIYHALNRGAHFNASTGRFTAPVTGTYHFQFNCTYSNFASGYLYFYMNINGIAKSYMQADQQTPQSAIVNHMYCELSANDYVDCSYTTNYISGIIRFAGFSGMLAG
jgi:hypothetical protein